jgi:hypothetical protein
MTEILLCRHACNLDCLDNIHDMHSLMLKHKPRTGPPVLVPYRPYLHCDRPSMADEHIITTLEHGLQSRDITDMAFDFGEENTIAIAEIAAGLRAYGAPSAGAAAAVYGRRMENFGKAVEGYQKALLEYQAVFKSDAAVAAAARQKAVHAFENLQKGFQREIEIVRPGLRRSKGLALTRASRGLNIARNSRRIAKLHISDELQATRLVRFGRYGRYLGHPPGGSFLNDHYWLNLIRPSTTLYHQSS